MQIPRLFRTASFRLTALYSAVFMLGFALLLLFTYFTLTAALRDQIKLKITEDLQTLATEEKQEGLPSIAKDIAERTSLSVNLGTFYYLEDSKGTKLAGNLEKIAPVEGWQERPISEIFKSGPQGIVDDDHQLWGQGIFLSHGGFLFVGIDAVHVLSAQDAVINTFLWSAAIALVLAAIIGVLTSQGFLRRIDAINRTSQSIMSGAPAARIPVSGTFDEIDQLSLNLNKLFDRNHDLLESLKQVTTNIAHDLRTPLSRLRQGLEASRNGRSSTKRYGEVIDNAIGESDQLLSTFSALLRIAQIESGSRKSAFHQFDLSKVSENLINAYRAVVEDQDKNLTTEIEKDLQIFGDSELVTQALANLLENALQHTPEKSDITFRLAKTPTGIALSVSDNGPGIPAEERKKVLERFYRLERSRTTPGNGLGLALVAAVAELHDIPLELQDNKPGLRVLLHFPTP